MIIQPKSNSQSKRGNNEKLTDEELQRVQAPTLFMIGENDVIYSAQKAVQRLKAKAPQIQTDVIPNAGHDLLIVQTDMVNQKIVTFLAGCGREKS